MKVLALRESVEYAQKNMRRAVGMESLPGSAGEGSGTSQRFDSFEGLSEAWSGDPGRFDAKGRLPKVPDNVALHKGYFAYTLPGWLEQHPWPAAFIHIDSDLYESARDIFELLGDRIVAGTVIVFDEYFNYPNWQDHEFLAFHEFVARRGIRYQYLAYARFQVGLKITSVG